MGARSTKRLAENRSIEQVLMDRGTLTPENLKSAQLRAATKKMPLLEVLIHDGHITDKDLAEAYAEQHGLEFVDLEQTFPEEAALALVPERIIKKYGFLPLNLESGTLVLAIKNPDEIMNISKISAVLQKPVKFKIAADSKLANAIANLHAKVEPKKVEPQIKEESELDALKSLKAMITQDSGKATSIEDLIKQIIDTAVQERASDIHIEPEGNVLRIRARTDGVLQEIQSISSENHSPIISRLKVLAGLDIAEKRNAQDGSFQLQVAGRSIDFRLSTLPTIKGEKAVLRVLDKSALRLRLEDLGMRPVLLNALRHILDIPHGLILVTGPTGSGKTTTVYSMLNHINALDLNIVTVEDPVELQFQIINQVQVNPKSGLTFASVLRNILRQDPDVVMIGEIRDKETADLAIRAALTGHLVISTIHTNDSLSTVTRLIDMGIEPFLVSSSLMGVVSQRLVRVLCPKCKVQRPLSEAEQTMYLMHGIDASQGTVCEPTGCSLCYNTGYRGRMPILELLVPNAQIKTGISHELPLEELTPMLNASGFQSMRVDGLARALEGKTSLEEVLKATV